MRKKVTAILICIMLSILFCACGAQGRPTSATEDKDLQKIFNYLEDGEYLKAQEMFEKNIIGNLTKEEAALEAFDSYQNAVLQDVNSGKLSFDEAKLICEAGYKAGFEEYLWDFEMNLESIQYSMACFTDGMNCFDSSDFKRAYSNLTQVLPQDINFGEALETIYQIALETIDSESVDTLLLSERCLKFVESSLEDYVVSELETDGEVKLSQLLHDAILKSAEVLQAGRRTLFAASQYANAAEYSNRLYTISDDPQKWDDAMADELNQYARLVREWNTLSYNNKTYYILTENGIETRGEPPLFTTTRDDTIQLVQCDDSWRGAYGVIYGCGPTKFGITDNTADYIDWVELTSDSWRSTESWHIPIKIFLDCIYQDSGDDAPGAIILYSDGTMDMYSVDPPSSYYELQNYGDVLDFISIKSINDEFAILTKSGRVDFTSGIQWLDLSSWEEISEITVGQASPAGYSVTLAFHPNNYLYGLDQNGAIYYIELLSMSKSDRIPESGRIILEDPVVKIAGSAYLTQSGVLGSLEPSLNDWLVANYGNYRFSSIAKADPGLSWHDDVIATTVDGEMFIIEFYDVMHDLFEKD